MTSTYVEGHLKYFSFASYTFNLIFIESSATASCWKSPEKCTEMNNTSSISVWQARTMYYLRFAYVFVTAVELFYLWRWTLIWKRRPPHNLTLFIIYWVIAIITIGSYLHFVCLLYLLLGIICNMWRVYQGRKISSGWPNK